MHACWECGTGTGNCHLIPYLPFFYPILHLPVPDAGIFIRLGQISASPMRSHCLHTSSQVWPGALQLSQLMLQHMEEVLQVQQEHVLHHMGQQAPQHMEEVLQVQQEHVLRHMGQQVQPMEEETQEHGSGDGEFRTDSGAAGDLAAAVGFSSSPLHDPVAAVGTSPLWNPDPAVAVGSASSALHDPDPAGLFPPCASSWVSWEDLVVVELGCGLALCSIVAAKLGAKVGDRVDMFSSAVPPFRWPHSTSSNIPPPLPFRCLLRMGTPISSGF